MHKSHSQYKEQLDKVLKQIDEFKALLLQHAEEAKSVDKCFNEIGHIEDLSYDLRHPINIFKSKMEFNNERKRNSQG